MTSAAVSAQGPTQNRVPGKFKLTALQASIGICLAVILFLGTCLCLWWSLDHTVPFWDLAHHAINVMTCSSLLTHPKLFLLDWWRELFCLSPYYPPLYYFVCATINIAVGRLETAQKLTNLLSVSVLVFSLYFLSYKYTKSRLTAAISSILPFLIFPRLFELAHIFLIDITCLSLIALSCLSFELCRKSERKLSWFITGCIFGLAVLAKQYAVIFLSSLCFTWLVAHLLSRDYHSIKYLGYLAMGGLLVLVPWAALALPEFVHTVGKVQQAWGHHSDVFHDFFWNLGEYCKLCLRRLFSVPGLLLGLFSVLFAKRSTHISLALLSVTAVVSFLATCSFRWIPQDRYLTAITIPVAIYSGDFLSRLLLAGGWRRAVASGLLLSAAWFFFAVHFCQGWFLDKKVVVEIRRSMELPGELENIAGVDWPVLPRARENGHQLEALKLIAEVEKGKPVLVGIVPDCVRFNFMTFQYLKQRYNLKDLWFFPVKMNTAGGDTCKFDQDLAERGSWYILNPTSIDIRLAGPDDQKEFERWNQYVMKSGKYSCYKAYELGDKTRLELWRKVDEHKH